MWLVICRKTNDNSERVRSSTYSGMMVRRKLIAEYLNLWDLEQYYGFGKLWETEEEAKKRSRLPAKSKCPVMYLINHSDCEWQVKVKTETRVKIHDQLMEIVSSIGDELWYYKRDMILLAEACLLNSKDWWYLVFC